MDIAGPCLAMQMSMVLDLSMNASQMPIIKLALRAVSH